MTLDDFIEKLFKRYVCATDPTEKKEEIITKLILLSGKVDFQKLLDTISEHNKKDFIPSVVEMLEWSKFCYKTDYKKAASNWIHFRIYNPILKCITTTDCFPSGTTEEAAINSYKKKFPNSEGWKVLEVYQIGG